MRLSFRLRFHSLANLRHLRMAGEMSQTGKGLGEINPFSRKLAPRRPHQVGNEKDRKTLKLCR